MHLIPSVGYGRAFVSHDEWVEISLEDAAELDKTNAHLAKAGVKPIAAGGAGRQKLGGT